jgi:hypothetical protein
LGSIGDPTCIDNLTRLFVNQSQTVRESSAAAISKILNRGYDVPHLLSRDVDGLPPWLDPATPIDADQVERASRRMRVSREDARLAYERLQERLNGKLQLGWVDNETDIHEARNEQAQSDDEPAS